MSHQPERRDKTCLNCGTETLGRFCHSCGQENIVPHQNFISLTKHFIYDIFHFDGKFFDTLKYMLTRPGYVAKEYVSGKRMSFLDPIRMYLFTSAIFFIFFFKVVNLDKGLNVKKDGVEMTNRERVQLVDSIQNSLGHSRQDSIKMEKLRLLRDTSHPITLNDMAMLTGKGISIGNRKYESLEEYKREQDSLPSAKRDGFLKSGLVRKSIRVNEQYEGNSSEVLKDFLTEFLHRLPILLFFSLPFFALILKLLYSGKTEFFYSDHAVFTLYQYIFSFILLLVLIGLGQLQNRLHWGLFEWLIWAGIIYGGVYLWVSMKNFYRQTGGKTTVKFLLVNMLGGIALVFLFLAFFLISIFEF